MCGVWGGPRGWRSWPRRGRRRRRSLKKLQERASGCAAAQAALAARLDRAAKLHANLQARCGTLLPGSRCEPGASALRGAPLHYTGCSEKPPTSHCVRLLGFL